MRHWAHDTTLAAGDSDGWYHVFGRGIERRDIFADNRDREHLLELLEGVQERYRFRIHAYAAAHKLISRLEKAAAGDQKLQELQQRVLTISIVEP